MLRIGATQRYYDALDAGTNDVQELSKTHEMVSRAKTQIWHRLLTHYLPLYFPETERFKGKSHSDWYLAFLEQFPTPGSIGSGQGGRSLKRPRTLSAKRSPSDGCSWISTRQPRDSLLPHRFAGSRRFTGNRHVPHGFGRGRRYPPFPASPAVLEVLRARSRHAPVRPISRPK